MNKKIIRALIVLVLIVLFSFLFSKESSKLYFLKNENAKIEKKIEELESQNNAYVHKINELKENEKYIEKVLREELGMIKEGEKIYKFENQQ
ncbi:MAG: FtsB family cell division protein [Thermodesulfobacteriota bacterium]